MPKIAIIGAGGYVFPLRLIGDLLSFPALQDSTLALMDINAERLERTASAARELVAHHGLPARVDSTTDRRAALAGADYVVITFQVGGIDAYRQDVEIPRRYGIDQPVGDTVGPGGVFRFLRSVPAYRGIASDIHALCPDAQVINYANPMAMATGFLTSQGVKTVGLCHSVQGTSRMLARELGVPYGEVSYRAAGINHQSWFLDFRHGHDDLYPRLRQVMGERHLRWRDGAGLADDRGDHSHADRGASIYEGGVERVRTSIMDAFGYFHTESSHHASEYLPYFRKTAEMVNDFIPRRWDYYEICAAHDEDGQTATLLDRLKAELAPSVEYGAVIVNAMETGVPSVIYGNVENQNLITNLPTGCCVEVPCLVDSNGVQPSVIGDLPPQCAAVNRTNINVQELAVKAALTGNREHVYHAVMLDPLTGALLTLAEIRSMVDDLIEAHAKLLPEELVQGASAPAVL
ncbi:alpha-glucosidase/alpha-galactosidase [Actinopolymorpha alba]|uniref:alpha-glucosidase/alpha-galactosidase n=1 Tax=Actinopolymorpha alba TaxID=533267 RepID=UPI0003811BD8|nr:alpha-glucosidase/alpha-galactosidase [Actinopolymorpha alba]